MSRIVSECCNPSYISSVDMEDVPGRVVFNGTAYTVGESAFRSGYHFDRNIDDNQNKVNNALITLLGGLAHLPHCKAWHLKLVVSLLVQRGRNIPAD